MIFVDTSVWVAAFRGAAMGAELKALLDREDIVLAAPVWIELLSGASTQTISVLREKLAAVPAFYPSRDTWMLVQTWAERGARMGEHFGAADLLIGALAAERGGIIWSQDSDFVRMARLKWIKLYRSKSRLH